MPPITVGKGVRAICRDVPGCVVLNGNYSRDVLGWGESVAGWTDPVGIGGSTYGLAGAILLKPTTRLPGR
jgi:hypothetical protein